MIKKQGLEENGANDQAMEDLKNLIQRYFEYDGIYFFEFF